MLKGKQKKLDKNNNGRIDAEDFKILQGSKKGMRMGGMMYAKSGGMSSDRLTQRDIEGADRFNQIRNSKNKPRNEALDKALRAVGKRVGGLSRQRLDSISNYRNKQAQMKKEKQKEENIRKTEISPLAAKKGKMIKAEDGAFIDYYSNTPKVDKKNLDRAGKGVGELIERIIVPPAAAIRDTGKAYKEFKKMQKRKQNKKDVEQIEAKSGKFIERRKKLGSLKSLFKSVGDFPLVSGTGESAGTSSSQFMKRRMKLSGGKKMGGVMKAKSGKSVDIKKIAKDLGKFPFIPGGTGDLPLQSLKRKITLKAHEKKSKGGMLKAKSGKLADAMKKLRERAYEKSGKNYKDVGKFGKDEYLIQKKLPGIKKGKMIKAKTGKSVDTIKITPTVKGKPMKARPFMPSKFDRGVMSRDYKFSKK